MKLQHFSLNSFVILLLLDAADGRTNSRCRLNSESEFRSCDCARVGPNDVNIRCEGKNWLHVPRLYQIFHDEDNGLMNINSLELKNGALAAINQDAFKEHQIQLLDLSRNNIHSLNVNAFRGLEETLRSLDLQHNSLNSIPYWSFTYLEQLQYLRLQDNEITTVGLNSSIETKLTNLHYVHLDRNRITKLESNSFVKLPLSVLTLSQNQIRQLDTDSLPTSLTILDLSRNLLEEIPYNALFNISQLSKLNLNGNKITNIFASQNVRFKGDMELDLSENRISKIEENAFASFQRLADLNLEMNKIDHIDQKAFSYVNKLEKLSLRYNKLQNLHKHTFGHLAKNLKHLNLGHNELQHLPKGLELLLSLEQLDLQHNKLESLDNQLLVNFKHNLRQLNLQFNKLVQVDPEVFDGMQRLEELDLSYNKIETLEKMPFGTMSGAASSLRDLNLAGNQITEITDSRSFIYLSSLTVLNLSSNRLQKISSEASSKLNSLKSLNLEYNEFRLFPKTSFHSLKKLANLQMNHNQIDELPVRALELSPNLIELHLMSNKIRTINDQIFHTSSSQKLEWLNLANNQIEEIGSNGFELLPRLFHLNLAGNKLQHINPQTFNLLPNLKYLNLERNEINVLRDYSFNQLPLLAFLSLAYNRLDRIDDTVFQNVSALEQLSLAHNQFTKFDLQFLNNRADKLAALDLSYNKLTRLEIHNSRHSISFLNLRHNNLEFIDTFLLLGCHKLLHLDLSLNSIMEIHVDAFQTAKKLKFLDLSGNQLPTIWRETFSHQELLEILDLSYNYLSFLEPGVFGKDNVVKLSLRRNNFSIIPTKALGSIRKSLKELDLSFNSIRVLDTSDFSGLHGITKLILSHNKIETIEANAFEDMPWLEYLDLSNNPITTWSPHVFRGISNVLKGINMAATGLFSLPKLTNKSVRFLNISSNKIYELQTVDVEQLKKLKILDLSNNNLRELSSTVLRVLSQLKHLNLNGNRIQELNKEHFSHLKELETLQVAHMSDLNRLPSAESFSHLIQLQNLHLHDLPKITNFNITNILHHLPPLRTLHFNVDSFILEKHFQDVDLRLLHELAIGGHKLKMIDANALNGIRRYQFKLIIRNTSLTELPSNLFENMNSVRSVELELPENRIETLELFRRSPLPFLNQHGTILEKLDLRGNPLICDCRMKWLSEWIQYYAEHSKLWPNIRHALASSRCSDRPGGLDNLLNMYDQSEREYQAHRDYTITKMERRSNRPTYESLSTSLDCRKKKATGLAAFFSSHATATKINFQHFFSFIFVRYMLF
ncbi:hypothetical protein M3Y96_01052000 [Aphelenchoides besseyi]|nr:hypothetical protein M3Y96_01052000 [Aphelenchoides besseyi]